mmetsp:Transcript_12649/g.11203  ORF Transcript_12649/g.11203 Transcript_12649/m.11203 type:complete len:84 (-) Transcript_12649:40-291(-)
MSIPVNLFHSKIRHNYSLSMPNGMPGKIDSDFTSLTQKPDIEILNRYAQYETKIQELEDKLGDMGLQNNELRGMVNTLLEKGI